jgi:predicted ArsR family transcriptional regulator
MQTQRLIQTVGRSARLKVLNELKRTADGLPVGELASRLGMSYMGVKDLCLDLEKRGLLDTWRHPQKIGRPQMLYRLTARAHELFPTASNPLTIDLLHAAQTLYGPAAADKLLLIAFQRKADDYQARIHGRTIAEKATNLAHLRDAEGHMAEVITENGDDLRIVEHHSPIRDLLDAFPTVAKLETELYQKVLGVPIRREEAGASGQFCATFHVGNGTA